MRLKQKQSSRKNVHMPIQPLKQGRSILDKIGIDKMSSPDALLSQNNDALQCDQIRQDKLQQLKLGDDEYMSSQQKQSSIVEQNAQNSKNTIQKEQQHKQKIITNYIHDHYEFILRPIGSSLIFYSIAFVLFFVFFKAFWIFQDISIRKEEQEFFLKHLLNTRITAVQKDYQHSFSFLDGVRQIYQQSISSKAIKSLNYTSCDQFNSKYLCDISSNFNQQFYQIIDLNYEIVSLQLTILLSHINVKNVFIVGQNDQNIMEFNLTKIINQNIDSNYQKYSNYLSNSFNHQQVKALGTYIKSFTEPDQDDQGVETDSSDSTTSYLDSQTLKPLKYEMFEVYIYQQNQRRLFLKKAQFSFNLYCLQIQLFYKITSNKAKLCLSIPSANNFTFAQNILFVKTDFPKIQIQNNTIANIFYSTQYMERFYDNFEHFIKQYVQSIYLQYHLDRATIIRCLKFHDSFHEMFAQKYVQLQIFRCYPSNYLHALVGKYIFAWSIQEADKISYHNSAYSLKAQDSFEFQSFVISNITYFKDIHQISNEGIQIIQNTLKIFGGILIAILFSFQASKYLIKQKMIDSLFTLKRLSKLVINVEDVKRSENQFKKILIQLKEKYKMPRTQIFGVFIGYLQKFLWIKKLYYYNKRYSHKKTQKRNVLMNGLNIFKYIDDEAEILDSSNKQKNQLFLKKMNRSSSKKDHKTDIEVSEDEQDISSDQIIIMNYKKYPAVLTYIYEELIFLRLEVIQNFQNVKVLSRRRQSSKRKSNQMHILHQIDNQRQSQPKYHYQKQQNEYSQQFSIYGQQLPQISIMDPQPRQNRGVRFSNQIQFKGFNQDEKKSKFRQHILSNSSIGKKSSLKSLKSIQAEVKKKLQESQKISKSEEDSAVASSSKKLKRDTTIKNILRGDQSVHQGLKTMKFDQNSNIYDQRSNLNKYSMLQNSFQQNPTQLSMDQFYYTHKQIFEETVISFESIAQFYQELIEIKQRNLEKMIQNKAISSQQEEQKINQIYSIEIKRLKTCFNYLKLLLDQSKGQQIDFQSKGINLNFDHLTFYQSNYEIHQYLLDKSILYKMKISICLGKTISYKLLQEICRSQSVEVCLQSNFLYAQELSKLQPFLDFQVINICNNCLSNYDTSITFKRKCLELMIKTLARRRDQFLDEIDQLQLIKRYYNRKHKKFYFIADMTESYDIFTPVLTKIYELMGKMDLMQIYNLGMNENLQDMQLVRQIIKPQTSQAFLSLFEQLTIETQKSKQKNSSKIIHKRVVYEKDFNEILDEIQKDETQFSSFLVIILGGDQLSNHSSIMTDDVDSSNNQRQLNQLLYSEINRKIQKNYYHIVQIGTYLNNFMTKQGKLKKHIKNCTDLLEIDLIKKNHTQHFTELQKFIHG